MEIKIDITDENIQSFLEEGIKRRINERIPYHREFIITSTDDKIKESVKQVCNNLDITDIVKKEVNIQLERILKDVVAIQIKNIVRLAIHKELENTKFNISNNLPNA